MRSLILRLIAWLKVFPLKTLVGIVLVSYVVIHADPFEIAYGMNPKRLKEAEFFPFSSFPMYSTFSDRPYLVYLTDENDQPLATISKLDVRTATLKKAYEGELKLIKKATGTPIRELSLEQKEVAGKHVLELLQRDLSPAYVEKLSAKELFLWEIILTRNGNEIESSNKRVAKIPL